MKEDMRKYNGGNKSAGRKPKAAEIKLAEKIRNVISDETLLHKLAAMALDDDNKNQYKALELLAGYLYGRPTQMTIQKEVSEIPQTIFINATKPNGKK